MKKIVINEITALDMVGVPANTERSKETKLRLVDRIIKQTIQQYIGRTDLFIIQSSTENWASRVKLISGGYDEQRKYFSLNFIGAHKVFSQIEISYNPLNNENLQWRSFTNKGQIDFSLLSFNPPMANLLAKFANICNDISRKMYDYELRLTEYNRKSFTLMTNAQEERASNFSENVSESLSSNAMLSTRNDGRAETIKTMAIQRLREKYFGQFLYKDYPIYFKVKYQPSKFELTSVVTPNRNEFKNAAVWLDSPDKENVSFEKLKEYGFINDLNMNFVFWFTDAKRNQVRVVYDVIEDKVDIVGDIDSSEVNILGAKLIVNLLNSARGYFINILPKFNLPEKSKYNVKSFRLFHDRDLEV